MNKTVLLIIVIIGLIVGVVLIQHHSSYVVVEDQTFQTKNSYVAEEGVDSDTMCPSSGRIEYLNFSIRCDDAYFTSDNGISFIESFSGYAYIFASSSPEVGFKTIDEWYISQDKNSGDISRGGVSFIKYIPSEAGTFLVYDNYIQMDTDGIDNVKIYGSVRTASLISDAKMYTILSRYGAVSEESIKEFDDYVSSFRLE